MSSLDVVTVRFPPGLLRAASDLAQLDDRPISEWVGDLVVRELNRPASVLTLSAGTYATEVPTVDVAGSLTVTVGSSARVAWTSSQAEV